MKITTPSTLKRRLMLMTLMSAGILVAAPVLASPPPWAPAHGARAHQRQAPRERHYVYYRDHVPIYYAPERGLWFWVSGGNWYFGANLPAGYRRYVSGGGVNIQLDTDHPYERNTYVEQHYGAPRRDHQDRPQNHGPRPDSRRDHQDRFQSHGPRSDPRRDERGPDRRQSPHDGRMDHNGSQDHSGGDRRN